jgi:hypothetical protein
MLSKTFCSSRNGSFGYSHHTQRDVLARAAVARMDADLEAIFSRAWRQLDADLAASRVRDAASRARTQAILAKPAPRRAGLNELSSGRQIRRVMCSAF